MASREVFSIPRKSKTQRCCIQGFLFFVLLQMKLPNVWGQNDTTATTIIGTDSVTTSPSDLLSAITSVQSSVSQNPLTTNENTSSTNQITSIEPLGNHGSTSAYSTTGGFSNPSMGNTVLSTSMNTDLSSMPSGTGNDNVSCPAFTCTSECYTQFMNETAILCPSSTYFCELMKQDMSYSVNCSASCGVPCGNTTLTNCSVDCCNTTNCLNSTLFTLVKSPSTTVAPTTSTTTTTTTRVTVPPTPANNGKKCHDLKCEGAACYKSLNTKTMLCPIGQDYCMLKKTTTGSSESWQGSCSIDCRKEPVCSATTTACHLECCNATVTASCLKLTGEVNMPNSATRGLHSPALQMASLLLLWILRVTA